MRDAYDPEQTLNYLQYLDANNLYGWNMIQKLPTACFKWVKDVDIFTPLEISKLMQNFSKSYPLEIDLKYPKALLDEHKDLPCMLEIMKIDKIEKLFSNLYDKKKNVVHI